MHSNTDGKERLVAEIRVRGESDGRECHEWSFLQFWNKDDAVRFLQAQMRKSRRDAHLLLNSYERFHLQVTLQRESPGAAETPPDFQPAS